MDQNLVVGSKDCPIPHIMRILNNDEIVRENWYSFAISLDTSHIRIKKLRQDLLLDKISYSDIICDILEEWVVRKGSTATLQNLIGVVEDDLGALGVGESLRLRFNLPCKVTGDSTSLEWHTISPGFQERVIANLKSFFPDVDFTKSLSNLKGSTLSRLMSGEMPRFFKETLPQPLSYYVGRKVIIRDIISNDIFQQNDSPDVFLFLGMERYELSLLATDKITSHSAEQLRTNISAKFMILDQPNHFNKICAKTGQPVHLLRKESDGSLRWIRSRGNMENLQKYAQNLQDQLDELSFCQKVTLHTNSVCISDSPGMGKSVLLSRIGRRLREMDPDNTVFFIVMSEFINHIKQSDPTEGLTKVVINSLKIMVSENVLGETLLESKMSSNEDHILIDLLLDGFDEVNPTDHELAYSILTTIQESFNSVRVWVTTRPHLLKELENTLHVLGHNMVPFTDEDQVNFLSSLWSRNSILDMDMARTNEFAHHCLRSIRSIMNPGDDDIAGIPVQCLLIGETYEEDAVGYSRKDNRSKFSTAIEPVTFTNLYRHLIMKRLEKYDSLKLKNSLNAAAAISVHTYFSLELLFPECVSKLRFLSDPTEHERNEVMYMGILEYEGSTQTARFIHRTFAEYFVANFAAQRLRSSELHITEINDFLFPHVLNCLEYMENGEKTFKFNHQLISYFLNSLMADGSTVTFNALLTTQLQPQETLRRVAHACTNADYIHLFNYFDGLHIFDKCAGSIFNKEFISLPILNSSLQLIRLVFNHFERHHELDLEQQVTVLRLAVERGTFSIFEFLIKDKSLSKIVAELKNGTKHLLHCCVKNSKNNSSVVIDNKVMVLQMLTSLNPILLEAIDRCYRTPLLSHAVHVRLIVELISAGANTLAQDRNDDTLLHLNNDRDHLSNEDYQRILTNIPDKVIADLAVVKGERTDTPLMRLLKRIDPLPRTLEMFKKVGADFNFAGLDKYPILATAIQYGRRGQTIEQLIKLGAYGWWKDEDKQQTLLHLAALCGNWEAIEVLLKDGNLDVNARDVEGSTPLISAITSSDDGHCMGRSVEFLIQYGADINAKNNIQGTPLQLAALIKNQNTRLPIIKYLINFGADVFTKDKDNQTFLHSFVQSASTPSPSEFHDMVEYIIEKGLSTIFNIPGGINDSTRLQHAVQTMDVEENTLSLLHAMGVNFNAVDSYGRSVLAYAVIGKRSNRFLSNLIHMFGADPKHLDNHRCSLLHTAAQLGSLTSLKFLLDLGDLDVNQVDMDGDTPLHCAAQQKDMTYEKCALLVQSGTDIGIRNNAGQTPLSIIMEKYDGPDKDKLAKLLGVEFYNEYDSDDSDYTAHCGREKYDCIDDGDINLVPQKRPDNRSDCTPSGLPSFPYPFGYTALHNAVTNNDEGEILSLLKNGAEINLTNDWQETPLHLASTVKDSSIKLIQFLIDYGADVFAKDSKNCTFVLIFIAQLEHSPSQFDSLVKYMCEKNRLGLFNIPGGSYEITPFQLEVSYQEISMESLSLLHANGVNFNASDKNGESILSYAISRQRNLSFISALVNQFGADCRSLNSMQNNLLHIAAIEGNVDTLKFLLGLETLKINDQDMKGDTPLHYALQGFDPEDLSLEKCKLLVSTGADVNFTNNLGETPLHLVAQWMDSETSLKAIKFLIDNKAGVFLKDSNKATFLHVLLARQPEPSSSSLFRDIIKYLDGKNLLEVLETPAK